MTVDYAPSPIEIEVDRLIARLSSVAQEPEGRLTVGEIVALLGAQSHSLILFVFSVLNMIPGPPGYGGSLAFTMIGFAIAMLFDRPVRVPAFIARHRIRPNTMLGALERLRRGTGWIGKVSQGRLGLLAGNRARPVTALFIILVCLPMMVPIPFINAVPNVGIAILCLSRVNGDGAGVLAGIGVALCGLVIAGLAIWGVVHIGLSATDMLVSE